VNYEVQPAKPDDRSGYLSAFDRCCRWLGAIQSGMGVACRFGGFLALFNLNYLEPWLAGLGSAQPFRPRPEPSQVVTHEVQPAKPDD
jgi:hypothetical protein